MSPEKISNVTHFYPAKNTLLTEERGLITNEGEIYYPTLKDGKSDPVVNQVLGTNNILHFHRTIAPYYEISDNQKTPEDFALQLEASFQWHSQLIRRELTVRAVELSILTDTTVNEDSIKAMSKGDVNYDTPRGILKKTDLDLTHIRKWASRDLKEGRALSLGDLITAKRLQQEIEMVRIIGGMMTQLTPEDTVSSSKVGHGQAKLRKGHKLRKEAINSAVDGVELTDALFAADLLTYSNNRWKTAFSHDQQDLIDVTVAIIKYAQESRANSLAFRLNTASNGQYRYFPSNLEIYKEAGLQVQDQDPELPERERIIAMTDEERAEAQKRQAERTAAEQARIKAEKARTEAESQAALEHDMPIIEKLNELARQHNAIIESFTKQTGKSLRDKGLTGKDSLTYRLSRLKDYDQNMLDGSVQVYAKLYEMATKSEDPTAELTEILLCLERIRNEYEIFADTNRLRSNAKPGHLLDSFKPELALLTRKWSDVKPVIKTSGHSIMLTPEIERTLEELLGLQKPDVTPEPTAEHEIVDDTKVITESIKELVVNAPIEVEFVDHESPLEKANRLAEQLDWVMMPEEEVTAEELVEIAEQAIDRKVGGRDKKPAVIEQYRMEALLELRRRYGGTLYRSSEKMLGDSDNLYFALRFRHLGDDNHYVVTENPVYGNATYVIREDILPLMPGETALTAIQLHRRHVRELGAKRIIHGVPAAIDHLDKVESRIEALTEAV